MAEIRGSRDPGASAQHLRVLNRQSARTTRVRAELSVGSLNNRRKAVAGFRYREVRRKDKMKKNNETRLRHWLGKVLRAARAENHYYKAMSVRGFLRVFVRAWCHWALDSNTSWTVCHVFTEAIIVPENLRDCLKCYVRDRLSSDLSLFCDVAWDVGYVPKWLCTKWVTVDLPPAVKEELCPWTGNGNHIVRGFARSLNEDAKKLGGRFMYSCTQYAYDSDRYVLVLPKGKKLTWFTTTKKEIELG